MAGYTPQFFLTLSIPFFGFVFWFLKRKNPPKNPSVNKAIQVSTASGVFEEPLIVSMKFKNQEESREEGACSDMQLKVSETQSQNGFQHYTNGNLRSDIQLNDTETQSQNGVQHSMKNGTMPNRNACSDMQLKESESQPHNGIQHYTNRTMPKGRKSKVTEKKNSCSKDTNDSGRLHSEDNETQISNDFENLDLNTELVLNNINKKSTMESEDSVLSSNSQTSLPLNHDSNSDSDHHPSNLKNGEQTHTLEIVSIERRNSVTTTLSHDTLVSPECTGETMLESPGATYCDSVIRLY